MRKAAALLLAAALLVLTGCGGEETGLRPDADTLVYASGEITRINPVVDEHGEINLLIFNGLTGHNEKNEVVPALASSWDWDEQAMTWTFHLREGVKWQDGEPFTSKDVKFTVEAVMDPENESEIASNFEEVSSVETPDDHTAVFKMKEKNVVLPEYLSTPIVPEHLLSGKNMQEDDYFRHPVGTGPYEVVSFTSGQSVVLKRNEDYFEGPANIENVVFKMVKDDSAKALQLESGEVSVAQVTPKDAQRLKDKTGLKIVRMETSDYRGVMYNFDSDFFRKNKAIIPALNYGVDRKAIVDTVLLGEGEAAYGPLQRNIFNFSEVDHFDYDPQKAQALLTSLGYAKNKDGIFEKDGEPLAFTLNCMEGDQVRIDMARIFSEQMKKIGVSVTVEIPAQIDWARQDAFLIGWGSPYDADDHTYKVFGTGKGSNFSAYSNDKVDDLLKKARETDNEAERAEYYKEFQEELAADPAFTFLCYVDADYGMADTIKGYTPQTILGHHGVGIFWNLKDWTIE